MWYTCFGFAVFTKFSNRESHLIACRLPFGDWRFFYKASFARPPRSLVRNIYAKSAQEDYFSRCFQPINFFYRKTKWRKKTIESIKSQTNVRVNLVLTCGEKATAEEITFCMISVEFYIIKVSERPPKSNIKGEVILIVKLWLGDLFQKTWEM